MDALPDDLWVEILHSGVRSGKFKHRDLCALAIVSTRLNGFSGLDFVWKELLAQEFLEPAGAGAADDVSLHGPVSEGAKDGWKGLYKLRLEKEKTAARCIQWFRDSFLPCAARRKQWHNDSFFPCAARKIRKENGRIQDFKTYIRCLENSLIDFCSYAMEKEQKELDALKYN